MNWLIALDVALYIGAIALFFTGYGILALICIVLAVVLTFILLGMRDEFSWFLIFDGITDLYD
jgi:hypothetical protein